MISESDWKKFKNIKEKALQMFCGQALVDIESALAKRSENNHSSFLYLYSVINNFNERIALIFDDHSRSKARIQLLLMASEGLISDEDLASLSEELRDFVNSQR